MWLKVVRSVLYSIPVVALGYFAYQYVNPSGVLHINYDFCSRETPYISGLSPHGRVLGINKKECSQTMVIDPVYFDVRLPQSYQKVSLTADFQGSIGATQIDIGVGRNPDEWDWVFNRSLNVPHKHPSPYYTTLDLTHAQFKNNRYRFIISSPGLDERGEKVAFKNMSLRFEKEPLRKDNIVNQVKKLVQRVNIKYETRSIFYY